MCFFDILKIKTSNITSELLQFVEGNEGNSKIDII